MFKLVKFSLFSIIIENKENKVVNLDMKMIIYEKRKL